MNSFILLYSSFVPHINSDIRELNAELIINDSNFKDYEKISIFMNSQLSFKPSKIFHPSSAANNIEELTAKLLENPLKQSQELQFKLQLVFFK